MMKPINEAYPEKLGWKYRGYVPLLNSLGYTLCVKYDTTPAIDQAGESIVLFRNPINKKYGILMYEWGYCSETDMLQHCESLEDVKSLRGMMKDKIHWEASKNKLTSYLMPFARREQYWKSKELWIQQRIWNKIGHQFLLKMKEYISSKGEESYIGIV